MQNYNRSNRGGGRKPLRDGQLLKQYTFFLYPEHHAELIKRGHGNGSAALRQILDAAIDSAKHLDKNQGFPDT